MRENSEERSVAGDRTRLACRRGHRHHDSSRAAARCSVSLQTYSPIKEGSTGAQAKAMECLLAKAGFATTVNGRFSAGDAEELAKFRKSIGLKPLLVGRRRAWSSLLGPGRRPESTCRIRPESSTASAKRSPGPISGTVTWSSSTAASGTWGCTPETARSSTHRIRARGCPTSR